MIFQTISSVRSNSLGMKYLRFTLSGCKDKGSIKYKGLWQNFISLLGPKLFVKLTISLDPNNWKCCSDKEKRLSLGCKKCKL